MYLKLLCLFVFMALIFCPPVYSAEEDLIHDYFYFTLLENLLVDDQEVIIKFKWNITDFEMNGQKRLTVKPFISGGAVSIYNKSLNKFIGTADFNSTLPYLQDEMLVKFNGVQSSESPLALYFVIYDTLPGKSYATNVKKVWGTAYYRKYTKLLNENLLKKEVTDGFTEPAADNPITNKTSEFKNPAKIYLWYLSPALFLYGLLKSPNGFG